MTDRHIDTDHRRPFDAIIFDLGSTLIYFEGKGEEIYQKANEELFGYLQDTGLPLEKERFLKEFSERLERYFLERDSEFIEYTTAFVLRSLLEEYGYENLSNDLIESALKIRYAISQEYWKAEAETHSVLNYLRSEGYKLAIISNAGDDADVQTLIDRAGIREYFDYITTSAAQGIRKPNPRIFRTALEHLKTEPSKAAMVGDTLGADILGAHNAGMYAIWITRRQDRAANQAHLDTIIPDATIDSLAELPGLLERIKKANMQKRSQGD